MVRAGERAPALSVLIDVVGLPTAFHACVANCNAFLVKVLKLLPIRRIDLNRSLEAGALITRVEEGLSRIASWVPFEGVGQRKDEGSFVPNLHVADRGPGDSAVSTALVV